MKRSILFCWTALIMFLSGCASVPDDVKTNNKTTENNCSEIEGEKITIEEALKDSSDIYNNDYQQIKIAPGLDLDFSNITGVTDYTLSLVAWDETDHRKVLDFFSGQGLYGKTTSEDSELPLMVIGYSFPTESTLSQWTMRDMLPITMTAIFPQMP